MTERTELQTAGCAVAPAIGIVVSDAQDAARHVAAVCRAAGESRVMTLPRASLDRIDGLVVASGPTIDKRGFAPPQDAAIDCVSRALDLDIPMLAVGGGFLALNAAKGGSWVEASSHAEENASERASAYHRIYIAPGGKLAAAVGSGGFVRVNSRHAFGVREAQKARGLLATAYSLEDGVIEALESPDHSWVVGVQFNPERRGELPPHFDRLFSVLTAQASARADQRSLP